MSDRFSSLWRRARGIYEAGGYEVTARHWWSLNERRSARLAAKVLAHEAPKIDAEVRKRTRDAMLYGFSVIGPDGEAVYPPDITADPTSRNQPPMEDT